MKTVIPIILLSAIILISCGTNEGVGNATTLVPKRDTSFTLAMYLGYGLRGVEYGPARRITWDTLTWVGKDSTTMKKEWTKFTVYDVEVSIAVKDSATARAVGVNSIDTVVRRILKTTPLYVRDGVTNWDSSFAELKPYIDTTKQKIDSSQIKK